MPWVAHFLASRACGRGSWRITLEHLPNILSVLIVQATIQFAIAILAEAALSYLGLGTQPPQPSWGRMLSEAQTLMFQAPAGRVARCGDCAGRAGAEPAGRRGCADLLDPASPEKMTPRFTPSPSLRIAAQWIRHRRGQVAPVSRPLC